MLFVLLFSLVLPCSASRQHVEDEPRALPLQDSLAVYVDSVVTDVPQDSLLEVAPRSLRKRSGTLTAPSDSLYAEDMMQLVRDSLEMVRRNAWTPDPSRAMWLGLVFPGGGQIYNRKFWKLPIVYGGVVACIYALNWNAQMLRDYSQAYQDISDSDPTTCSYLDMLPLGYDITGRESHFISVFKRKKDFYRRYRDLSIFFMVGVYVLSVLDAYVDAELTSFDISKDLSLSIMPGMIQTETVGGMQNPSGAGVTLLLHY